MVGDSKVPQWMPALDLHRAPGGWRLKVWSKSACGFAGIEMEAPCLAYNATLSAHLTEDPPDVLITSMVRSGGEALGTSVAELLRPIQEAGTTVVVLADNPAASLADLGDQHVYECVADHRSDLDACRFPSGTGSGTRALRSAADQLDATFIDLEPWICPPSAGPEPRCPAVVGRVLLFRQGSHLTATYVSSLTPILHHELVVAGVATTRWSRSAGRSPSRPADHCPLAA